MKIYRWAAGMACLALMAVGCHTSPVGDDFADKHYGAQGALIVPSNVQVGFFDLASPADAGIAFDVSVQGEAVSSAEITVTHNDGATGTYQTVSTFPSTIDVPMSEVLSALGIPEDSVQVGDEIVFEFESVAATGTYKSNQILVAPFSCKSDLAGKMDYVTSSYFCTGDNLTGEVELTEDGAGKYVFSDWAFGSYDECYGGPAASWGTLQMQDVCNAVGVLGADSYGDTWTVTVNSVSGAEMSINWVNTYGEFGTTVLTRQDGNDWPPLTN